MERIKASPKHKLGNMTNGVCAITEGLILIFTLGNYHPGLQIRWSIYRLKTGKLHDSQKLSINL